MSWIKRNWYYVLAVLFALILIYYWFGVKKMQTNAPDSVGGQGSQTTDALQRARDLYNTNTKVKAYANWAVGQDWLREKAAKNGISVWDQAYLDAAWMYDNGKL